jgi:glycosyltransferase involved in cell wall biosynthesis
MIKNRIKTLFISANLKQGGAERVLATILQHLDKTRFETTLILFQDIREYQIPEDTKVISLGQRGWWDYPLLIWKLSRLFNELKPDVVLGFLTYMNVLSSLAKKLSFANFRLILCEHAMPAYQIKQTKNPLATLFIKWMPYWFYRHASMIICVSRASAIEINKIFKVPFDQIRIIYNPIDVDYVLTLSNQKVEHPWFTQNIPIIISVGRLANVKGYPYLLRAFKQIITKYPARLVILGKGEEEGPLKKLALKLDIDQSVAFLGSQTNPFKYMARSKIFVLPSLSEALPMVLLEAMACGIPIVSTSTPGSSELITHGINGLLVPVGDEKSLAESITDILTHKTDANLLIQSGKKKIDNFLIDNMIKEYEKVFEQAK